MSPYTSFPSSVGVSRPQHSVEPSPPSALSRRGRATVGRLPLVSPPETLSRGPPDEGGRFPFTRGLSFGPEKIVRLNPREGGARTHETLSVSLRDLYSGEVYILLPLPSSRTRYLQCSSSRSLRHLGVVTLSVAPFRLRSREGDLRCFEP